MRAYALPCLLLIAVSAHAEISAIYGKYVPTGIVNESFPTVTWKVTPTGGGHVSRVEMLINEKLVEAGFDATSNSVVFKPKSPMPSGLYTVLCRVTIENQLIVRQDWSFEVKYGDAVSAPTNASGPTAALDATNAIRTELGLPVLSQDQRIASAAAAHSRYQALNGETSHFEEPGKPGYTAKAPWDRIQRFGYPGVCFEGACSGQNDPAKSIRLLFNAPYHRIPFLQPGAPPIGIGFEGGAMTVDYAVSVQEGVGMSPAPGQVGSPLSWDGNESPSPLTIHQANGPVGYPIVFGWFSPRLEAAKIESMRLRGPQGIDVPCYLNTPANDQELRFAGILTPKSKLQPNTTYSVEVKATNSRNVRIDRTWSFTTGPMPQ